MIVLAGTFTTEERRGRAKGVRAYEADAGGWTLLAELPAMNPSYLVRHPVHRGLVYTCHSDGREVSAIQVGSGGAMELVGSYPTGGYNGAHLAISPDARVLVVANFSSGNLSVFPLGQDGLPSAPCRTMELEGATGPHRLQTACQPHQVNFSPEGSHFFVPDRGCDRVRVFRYDVATQSASEIQSFHAAPGQGPRHLDWHPDRKTGYVLNEIGCSITACEWDEQAERLVAGQTVPALPPGITTESISGAICVSRDGRFAYASTRGHDCVGVYDIADTMAPRVIQWVDSVGSYPRFMEIGHGGEVLWITSNRSDDILGMNINLQTGLLTDGLRLKSPSPTCLLFMEN